MSRTLNAGQSGARLVLLANLAFVCGVTTAATPSPVSNATTATVILIRHAEKAAEPGSDPPLSAAGQARSEALVDALRDAKVTAIITTQFRRTRDTAEALAKISGVTPQVVAAGGGLAKHVEAVLAAVRENKDGVVLVVGHSNTVAPIIAALGGPKVADICETVYSSLFTLIPLADSVRLVKSNYGAPDAAGAGC